MFPFQLFIAVFLIRAFQSHNTDWYSYDGSPLHWSQSCARYQVVTSGHLWSHWVPWSHGQAVASAQGSPPQ